MNSIKDIFGSNGEDGGWFEKSVVNRAPMIMAFFANFVVLVADIRVFDVMYRLTGVWWKALSASLACAVPFLLWEIAWRYNHTTDGWRVVSLIMAGLAFATSIFLGVADFLQFDGVWANWLLGGVVVLTGIHSIVALLYFYNDPDVARTRRKQQADAKMADQEMNARVATNLLENGRNLLITLKGLESEYGSEELEAVMGILSGDKKKKKPTERRKVSRQAPALPASSANNPAQQISLPPEIDNALDQATHNAVSMQEASQATAPFSKNGNNGK